MEHAPRRVQVVLDMVAGTHFHEQDHAIRRKRLAGDDKCADRIAEVVQRVEKRNQSIADPGRSVAAATSKRTRWVSPTLSADERACATDTPE